MTTRTRRARLLVLAASTAFLLILPVSVAAHAQLDTATPADGATVEGTPPEVSGTYTQEMKADGSSMQLRDATGKVLATGAVDPDDPRHMAVDTVPELAPGEYEVRWTTLSAEDDEVARGTWSFTVKAAPSEAPTPEPTASAVPSAAPSAAPTAAPTVAPTPAPSPAPTQTNAGGSDVIVPIIAGLAIVAIAAGLLLSRRGRPSDGA